MQPISEATLKEYEAHAASMEQAVLSWWVSDLVEALRNARKELADTQALDRAALERAVENLELAAKDQCWRCYAGDPLYEEQPGLFVHYSDPAHKLHKSPCGAGLKHIGLAPIRKRLAELNATRG